MIFDIERGFVVRITESRLRRVINNVISEMSYDMTGHSAGAGAYEGMGGANVYASNQEIMPRAQACMSMDVSALVAMCAEICKANSSMAQHCVNLCEAVLFMGNMSRCYDCLETICECATCCEICERCCNC